MVFDHPADRRPVAADPLSRRPDLATLINGVGP